MQHLYADRRDAGQKLARALQHLKGVDAVVLALPRGGAVLGQEVAKALRAPLGLILVKKIGHPAQPEYAIGAIAENAEPIYSENEVAFVDETWLDEAESSARDLMAQRRKLYFNDDVHQPELKGKTVILVDDGIATGLTMEAAVQAVLETKPKYTAVAAPVASADSVSTLERIVDEVIILESPRNFLGAVGGHYRKFEQVDDTQVRSLLKEMNR